MVDGARRPSRHRRVPRPRERVRQRHRKRGHRDARGTAGSDRRGSRRCRPTKPGIKRGSARNSVRTAHARPAGRCQGQRRHAHATRDAARPGRRHRQRPGGPEAQSASWRCSTSKDSRSLPATLAATVLKVAALGGDRALYDQYVAKLGTLAAQPEEYYRFFNALSWFKDPAL